MCRLPPAAGDNFARASSGTDSVCHHAGYIHTSNNRKFVDGFNLNLDRSYATPFNPERMFDKNSTVQFSLKSCKVRIPTSNPA